MYKSMKSSWIKMSYSLKSGKKNYRKWVEEIQQSLTDKAQCTPSLNTLCSDKVRVKKGKKSKTEEAFLKSDRGLWEK